MIVRLALLTGAAFMALTVILLTGNHYLYLVLLPLLGAFWLARPGWMRNLWVGMVETPLNGKKGSIAGEGYFSILVT